MACQLSVSTRAFLTFPLLFAVSIVIGRATRLTGNEVSLVWPAAAVGVMWLLAVRRYPVWVRVIHLAALGIVAFTTNLATGATVSLSAWFVLVNLALAVVTVRILYIGRDEPALRDPADLAHAVLAVLVGTVCAAVLATMYLVPVTGAPAWETFALFVARNGASALVGVMAWLRLRDVEWRLPRMSAAAVVEALIAGTVIALVLLWIFWFNDGTPVTFVALLPAAWVALRYSTTAATLFLTVVAGGIIYATLSDRGPLLMADPQLQALLAQGLICSLTVITLALALYRDSRMRLIGELEAARDRADRDSELLGAVLDSIHDGVVLVDPADRVILQNARAGDPELVEEVVAAARAGADAGEEGARAPGSPRDVVIEGSRVLELTAAPLPRQPQYDVVAFRDVTEVREFADQLRQARDLFAGVLEAASEQAIVGTDAAGRITVFNHGAERLLGWTEEEMLGRTPMDFHYLPEVLARADELGIPADSGVFVANVTPDAAEIREWTYVRRDGSPVAVSLAVSQMTDENGACVGFIGVATDITERKRAERALAESEERFRLAFDTAPMGMFMFSVGPADAGRITRCNQTMAELLGCSVDDVPGMSVTELGTDQNPSSTDGLACLAGLQEGDPLVEEVEFRRRDGATVWGAMSASVVAAPGADPYGICLVEDITGRKIIEAELQRLALYDALTGLANRALLTNRVESALADIQRHPAGSVGLLFLDLDGFKPVNDTWGHAQGDDLLRAVARRIESSIRPEDTAARLGGDEFAVLCPAIGGDTELRSVAERIRREIGRPYLLDGGHSYDRLSASIGAATSDPAGTAESLLRQADRLMYQAKRDGKNRVVQEPAATGHTRTAVSAE